MRVFPTANVALCLLLGSALPACSSGSGDAPYDAGELPDGFYLEGSDAAPTDGGAQATGADSGDANASAQEDGEARPSEDAGGDAFVAAGDAGIDGSQAEDAGEGLDADVSPDADAAGGNPLEDAGDASSSAPIDASVHDAGGSMDGAADASATNDASSNDAAGDAPASADDAGPASGSNDAGVDAATLCATFDPASNPILGVAAFDGTSLIVEDSAAQGYVSGSGSAGDADPVTVRVWTAPVGIMTGVHVVFTTNGFQSTTDVPLVSMGAVDAGPSGYGEGWAGTIPAAGQGAQVIWYTYGNDVCASASQYFSNNGNNYEYTTP